MAPNEYIYQAYPRQVGRVKALAAIAKAAARIVKETHCSPLEAQRRLFKLTMQYRESPVGSNPDKQFIPHPATFFNQGRYLDDQNEWERVSNGANRGSAGAQRVSDQIAELAKAGVHIPQRRAKTRTKQDGFVAERGHGRSSAGIILEGNR